MDEIQLLQERCMQIRSELLENEVEHESLMNELNTLQEQINYLEDDD